MFSFADYEAVRKVSKSLLCHYTLPKF